MDAADTPVRVDMLGAHLIGITFSRYVLGVGPLAVMPAEELTAYLAANLREILFGPVPTGPLREHPTDR